MDPNQIGAAAIIISFYLCILFVAYRLGYFWLPSRQRDPQLNILSVLGAFLIVLVIIAVVAPLGLMSYQWATLGEIRLTEAVDTAFYGWFSLSLYFLLAVALWIYCIRVIGAKETGGILFGFYPESHRRWARDAVIGMSSWLLAIFPVSACHNLLERLVRVWHDPDGLEQIAVKQLKETADSDALFLLTAVSMIILIPFMEELLFRGILQSWLRSRLGRLSAVFLTSVLFALAHFSTEQGVMNIPLLGTLFLFSLFLGFIYERQQSIVGPYALHALFNGVSVMTIVFQRFSE